jgi:hypothetical protein
LPPMSLTSAFKLVLVLSSPFLLTSVGFHGDGVVTASCQH